MRGASKADVERPLWRDNAPLKMLILEPGGFSARDPLRSFMPFRDCFKKNQKASTNEVALLKTGLALFAG